MRRLRALAARGPGGTATPQQAGAASSAPSNRSDTFDAHAPTTPPDADTTGTDPVDPPDEPPAGHSTPQSLGTRSCQCPARTLLPSARAAPRSASRSQP